MELYNKTNDNVNIICGRILIPVVLEKADIMQALKISHSFNTYAYDAYYLEVAHRLQIPLMTLDQKMKNIGNSLNINLLEI